MLTTIKIIFVCKYGWPLTKYRIKRTIQKKMMVKVKLSKKQIAWSSPWLNCLLHLYRKVSRFFIIIIIIILKISHLSFHVPVCPLTFTYHSLSSHLPLPQLVLSPSSTTACPLTVLCHTSQCFIKLLFSHTCPHVLENCSQLLLFKQPMIHR